MRPVPRELEGQAETIGQRLRRLRHERGLSQRELSSPGVSYAYISRIEAGARRPSVKALRMLAKKLGVSADYLETGSEIRDTDERELRIADAELELRLADEPGRSRAEARGAARRGGGRRRRGRGLAREHRARARRGGRGPQRRRDRTARGGPRAVAGLAERPARRLRHARAGPTPPPAGRTVRSRCSSAAWPEVERGCAGGPDRAGSLHDLPQLRAHRPRRPRARAVCARHGARPRQTR